MDLSFLQLFMEQTHFSEEDKADMLAAVEKLGTRGQAALTKAAQAYAEAGFSAEVLNGILPGTQEAFGVHRYTLWLLVLIHCSQAPYERSENKPLFWETFSDIRYKVRECRDLYGICGNFVGFWYPIFFTDSIVKLGRLEFETSPYLGREPVTVCGLTISPGDPVLSIHIPSSGEPFTPQARLDSYRRAYDHFRCAERGVPLICFCESWLLYPPYAAALPESSQIRGFSRDFCHIYGEETPIFDDFWRVYGSPEPGAPALWPEKTSLQRSLKAYFLSGGKPGFGMGLLIFDGEKLIQNVSKEC